MLKLTRKVEYALIALGYIQRKEEDCYLSAKNIAEVNNIPLPLLSKILQNLSKAKIIHSVKGAYGGYALNINPKDLSIERLINILEGPIGIIDCSIDSECVQIDTCNIKKPIQKINNTIVNVLKNITLEDISEKISYGRSN